MNSLEPDEPVDNSGRPNRSNDVMDALLADYQMARDDDRAAQSILSTMIGVAIALLAALIAALVQNYPLSREAFAIAPLLPLGAISYVLLVGSTTTMRSFYMRALEEELRRRIFTNNDLTLLPGVKPMSGAEFLVSISSGVRGRLALRLAYAIILGTILVVFGGVTILIGNRVGGGYALIMFVVYTPLALTLFIEGVAVGIAGRSTFQAAISRFKADGYASVQGLGDSPSVETDERSLRSYLLFPRPGDLIKWTFVPVSAGLGILLPDVLSEFSAIDLLALLSGWLAFEYLAYQARYQINDVRGLAHDLGHPEKHSRMRLPICRHGIRASVQAALAAVGARLVVLVVILVLNPFDIREELGIAALAVFLVAIPYEYLRSREPRDVGAGRHVAVRVWIIVGAGYAIRVCLGLSLVGIGALSVLAIFAVSAWFFGVMFVTLTWVLEATSYLYKSESGQYYYLSNGISGLSEDSDDEGEPVHVQTGLEGKPHLLHLLPFICVDAAQTDSKDLGSGCSEIKFLESGSTLLSPWNLMLLGSASSMIIACNLASTSREFGGADGGILVVTTVFAYMLIAVRSQSETAGERSWSTFFRFGVLILGLITILGLSVALSVDYTWTVLAAFLIFGGLYTFFRASSYRDIVSFNKRISQQVSQAKRAAIRVLIGHATFESAFGDRIRRR